jgi:uncharacterized protein (TIGR00255 family)
MTAFARTESRGDYGQLSCEIRSVNHRFLEPGFRLPEALRDLEFALRDKLRQALTRGKVDVQFRYEAQTANTQSVVLNRTLAEQYIAAASEIDQMARHAAPLNASEILSLPGVICRQEIDNTALQADALSIFEQALAQFIAMREREGSELARLIEERLAAVLVETAKVRERMPHIIAHYRDRLTSRLSDIKAELNPERLEQEMVLFLQKIDIAEEMDRLEAHVSEIRRVLKDKGAVGRRLDFLMQELNREANTLGSKSVSADSTLSSVELKVLIEQMREQIQNIE